MPTVINTNLASLFAQNSLSNAQNNLAQSVQRLSSGLRINGAKDDAAGLAIAQSMQSSINGVNQSIRNLSDATNLLQTADTGLATVQDMLLRMKQLSVQGFDGSLSSPQKVNIVTELNDLNAEINATANRTTFNNLNLLGSAQGVDSATGDIAAGKFLTKTAVADDTTVGEIFTDSVVDIGPFERAKVDFAAVTSGATVILGGLTFTATTGGATAAQLASAFAHLKVGITAGAANTQNGLATTSFGTFTAGTLASFSTAGVTNNDNVTFTSTVHGAATDLAKTGTGADPTIYVTADPLGDTTTQASYEIIADPESDAYRMLPGTYTFSAEGNQLTLSATIDGVYRSQTVIVEDAPADVSANQEKNQQLDYSDFGIRLNLSTTVSAGDNPQSGESIAALMDTKLIDINGASAKITDVNVSSARTGTYTFTRSGADLTATFNDQYGNTSVETVDLESVGIYDTNGDSYFYAGDNYRIKFNSLGISFDIHAYQNMTAAEIATEIAALDNYGLGTTTGELYVVQGENDRLKFQSGPNSDSFIQVNTLNIRTDANSGNIAMRELGTKVSTLASLDASDSVDNWQDAFMNLDAAVENAQVYISQERAVFGSQMNRVNYLSTNLSSQSTNLQNSRSSIIDTDFASETAKLTRGQIMQQAATAMLAQANQMPNVVLSLLK